MMINMAVGAGLCALFCLVLAILDHRARIGRGLDLWILGGILSVLSIVGWVGAGLGA